MIFFLSITFKKLLHLQFDERKGFLLFLPEFEESSHHLQTKKVPTNMYILSYLMLEITGFRFYTFYIVSDSLQSDTAEKREEPCGKYPRSNRRRRPKDFG